MLRSIVVFILFLSVASCQNPNEKILVKDVDNHWKKNDAQIFNFDVNDAHNQKNMMFEEKRTNFNNDFLSTFNYIYNFRNDWKLKFVTIYNKTENRNYVDSYYRFDYENVNFANTESKVWRQKNIWKR